MIGFSTYKRHVGDLRALCLLLFHYVATGDPKRPTFSERIQIALTLIAALAPVPFLDAMGDIGADTGVLMAHKVLTVKLIGWVVTKYAAQFNIHSQIIVDYLMSLLNPGQFAAIPNRITHVYILTQLLAHFQASLPDERRASRLALACSESCVRAITL